MTRDETGETLAISPVHCVVCDDHGCEFCPVDAEMRCTCTYGAYARHGGGTGWDVIRYDPACPEHS